MPITGKTPIADLGDNHPIDDATLGLPPSGFGAPAPGGFGATQRVEPTLNGSTAPAATSSSQTNLTAGAATAVAGGAESSVENTNTDWINKKWRPVMGWMYMMVCVCDFTLFPVLWSILQAVSHGSVTNQWQPLTLQGAGLFHVAMGAVLGIAAYGRTKEKVAGAA
jgi:hypothetical protein